MWCLSNNILKVVSPFLAFVLLVLSIFLAIFLPCLDREVPVDFTLLKAGIYPLHFLPVLKVIKLLNWEQRQRGRPQTSF